MSRQMLEGVELAVSRSSSSSLCMWGSRHVAMVCCERMELCSCIGSAAQLHVITSARG